MMMIFSAVCCAVYFKNLLMVQCFYAFLFLPLDWILFISFTASAAASALKQRKYFSFIKHERTTRSHRMLLRKREEKNEEIV